MSEVTWHKCAHGHWFAVVHPAWNRYCPSCGTITINEAEAPEPEAPEPEGKWPRPAPQPEPDDIVQVMMRESMARVFEERCLGDNTRGHTYLAVPLLFREDDFPTYIIGVAKERLAEWAAVHGPVPIRDPKTPPADDAQGQTQSGEAPASDPQDPDRDRTVGEDA
jgi:hypothetical protein